MSTLKEMLALQRDLLAQFEKVHEQYDGETAEIIEADLAAIVGDIRGKTDAIKAVVDALEANAEAIKEKWIKPLKRKADAMLNDADRLKDYVKSQMLEHGYEKLPGNAFSANIQKGTPAVNCSPAEPLATHYLAYPDFIIQEVNYRWDKRKIKETLDAGVELSFASLRSTPSLRFRASIKNITGPTKTTE